MANTPSTAASGMDPSSSARSRSVPIRSGRRRAAIDQHAHRQRQQVGREVHRAQHAHLARTGAQRELPPATASPAASPPSRPATRSGRAQNFRNSGERCGAVARPTMNRVLSLADVHAGAERIAPYVVHTPLERSASLSDAGRALKSGSSSNASSAPARSSCAARSMRCWCCPKRSASAAY